MVRIEQANIIDLRKALGQDPAMQQCLTTSRVIYQGLIEGEIACVWGLVPPTIMSTQAYIWLHTTPIAEGHTFILVRYSQLMVEKMLKEYEPLVGHCAVGNDRAIRWMKWLGATFGEPQGRLIPFTIRRKHG